jgi:hypothetical protein
VIVFLIQVCRRGFVEKVGLAKRKKAHRTQTLTYLLTDEDDADQACGPHSNCINRLTQVECLRNECQTGRYCMNQR